MTSGRTSYIWCDWPGCETQHPNTAETIREVREMAREDGWVLLAGVRDFCPVHAASAELDAQALRL